MNIDKFGRHLLVGVANQTNIDKFGRHINNSADLGHQHISTLLPLTVDGHYNVENRRLCNVHAPKEEEDCANKAYVDKSLKVIEISQDSNIKIMNDIHTLEMNIDRWKQDQNSTLEGSLTSIARIKQVIDTHSEHLAKLKVQDNRIKFLIDEATHKLRREYQDELHLKHTHTKEEFRKLAETYQNSIQILESKVKSVEQAISKFNLTGKNE